MARIKVSREEVVEVLSRAPTSTKRARRQFLRVELERLHPGLAELKIRRNGEVYNALDYLESDLVSYGETEE